METADQVRSPWDCVVIGGGPAGLATAIATRRAGLRVLVAERAPAAVDKVCGEGLMPDGVSALADLGIRIPPQSAVPFRGIRFIERDSAVTASFPNACGLGIRRTTLHKIMVDHAGMAGVLITWEAKVTGLCPGGVLVNGKPVACRWVVGADGQNSLVRKWSGLNDVRSERIRFGRRRHFKVTPWTEFVEVYWGPNFQIVVTPVESKLVCAALVTVDPRLRLETALASLPALSRRFAGADTGTKEQGGISVLRRIRSVSQGNVALVGDASGSVESLTGEGLSQAFRQSAALARAIANRDLPSYAAEHRKISRLPVLMSRILLAMDRHYALRGRVMPFLAARPGIFSLLLNAHAGFNSPGNPPPRRLLGLGSQVFFH